MQIKDYTAPELEHFREACNVTSLEREFFDAVPLGAELLTSLWDSMNFGWPLPARFDRNFN